MCFVFLKLNMNFIWTQLYQIFKVALGVAYTLSLNKRIIHGPTPHFLLHSFSHDLFSRLPQKKRESNVLHSIQVTVFHGRKKTTYSFLSPTHSRDLPLIPCLELYSHWKHQKYWPIFLFSANRKQNLGDQAWCPCFKVFIDLVERRG